MIFKPWYRYKIRQALKTGKQRHSPGYKQAGQIGLLFFYDDNQKLEAAERLVSMLKTDGKKVKVLACERKKTIRHLPYDSFSQDDFGFWGSINHKGLQDFIKAEFDYLICLDQRPTLLERYIISGSQAKCRVGFYEPGNEETFEMLVAPGQNGQDWVLSVYNYLKQLS